MVIKYIFTSSTIGEPTDPLSGTTTMVNQGSPNTPTDELTTVSTTGETNTTAGTLNVYTVII